MGPLESLKMISEVKYNATKLFYPSKDFYRGIHKLLQDSSFSPKIAKHFFRDDQRINLVQSRPCKENEKMTYDFTGNNAKVIDGKFEGPGKLTIHQMQAGIAKERCNMPHFKAFAMINLQYEIRIW